MYKKIVSLIFLSSILFMFTGCITKSISQKGFIFDDDDLSNIKVGLTNRENTIKYLGYPLNRSYFNDNIWIYYSYTMKEVLFFKPSISDQRVLVIEFDTESDVVKDLSLYNIDSNKYQILDTENESSGDKENFIKDILRNIGQVSM